MADVKLVILSTFGAGALLVLVSIIAIAYLRRRSTGACAVASSEDPS